MKALPSPERIARLRPADYADTARAARCVLRVWFSLHTNSLPGTLARLGLQQNFPEASSAEVVRSQQVTRWAHRILPIGENCLLDSLAAALWLRSRRVSVPLVIGVRHGAADVEAHAWLEGSEEPGNDFRVLWRSHGSPQ